MAYNLQTKECSQLNSLILNVNSRKGSSIHGLAMKIQLKTFTPLFQMDHHLALSQKHLGSWPNQFLR